MPYKEFGDKDEPHFGPSQDVRVCSDQRKAKIREMKSTWKTLEVLSRRGDSKLEKFMDLRRNVGVLEKTPGNLFKKRLEEIKDLDYQISGEERNMACLSNELDAIRKDLIQGMKGMNREDRLNFIENYPKKAMFDDFGIPKPKTDLKSRASSFLYGALLGFRYVGALYVGASTGVPDKQKSEQDIVKADNTVKKMIDMLEREMARKDIRRTR